ncbi:MAG: hypothetical protein AB8H47_01870 [Bacteroidia bacterium]
MNQLQTLISGDIKQIFRDRTLSSFMLVPVMVILFIRLFVPYLTQIYPIVADYHLYIMMFGGMQTAIMFGFITSFIILEEKDENVLQVIRVLPISPLYFMVYRLSFATLFSAIGAFVMLQTGGIAYPGLAASILLSFQYGLIAPLISLIIATYANNKIEGMAFFKGVDLALLLPVLSFFVPSFWGYLFGIIPTYWTYTLYERSLSSGLSWGYFIAGLAVYGVVIVALFVQFRKRVFDR